MLRLRVARPGWIALLVAVAVAAGLGYFVGHSQNPPVPTPTSAGKPAQGPAVVRWNGGQLTAAQLQARIVSLKQAAGLSSLDAERSKAFADQAIRSAILAAEARARGLDADPAAEGPLAELLARTLIERELEDPARREKLTDEEISAWYAAHKDEFMRTELIRLADIVGTAPKSNGALRTKVRSEFEALKKKLTALAPALRQEPFAEAAKKRSDDKATGPGGGDLGNLSRAQLEQRLGAPAANAAWLMVGVGQVELFETTTAFT
jgi:hypothetical protein